MKGSQQTSYDTKTGFIKKIKLTIYPDDITVKDSRNGSLYLLDAIKDALIKDNRRAIKETKQFNIDSDKMGRTSV